MVKGIGIWPTDPTARARLKREYTAGEALGHEAEVATRNGLDLVTCTCGWKSPMYEDGVAAAHENWLTHIKAQGAFDLVLSADES